MQNVRRYAECKELCWYANWDWFRDFNKMCTKVRSGPLHITRPFSKLCNRANTPDETARDYCKRIITIPRLSLVKNMLEPLWGIKDTSLTLTSVHRVLRLAIRMSSPGDTLEHCNCLRLNRMYNRLNLCRWNDYLLLSIENDNIILL